MPRRVIAVAVLLSAVSLSWSQPSGSLFTFRNELKDVRGGQRLPDATLDSSRVPGQVTVLEAEDIRASRARTLQELLGRQAGVVTLDEVGNNHQQTIDLRGFNGNPVPATAVFVDGVRVNEANFGQINWHLIPLEHVERVEIHPGPSTLHGKNALGGVIHITTRRGQPGVSVETGAGYGSGNRRKAWASAAGASQGFDYLVSTTREDDAGYRRHSEAGLASTLLKLGYKAGERSDISFSYLRADDRLQQPGSLTGTELAQDRERNVSEVDNISRLDQLTYNQRQALPLDFSLALNGHLRKRREDTPMNRGRTSISHNLVQMESSGLAAQLSRDSEILERRTVATFGLEATDSEADTSSSGDFGGFPFTNATFTRDESLGLFGQATTDLLPDHLTLTVGVRYDQADIRYEDKVAQTNSGSQAFNRTNPRVGLNWNPSERLETYALYSEAFRVPTANEISALGPFGQSLLRPVKGRNHELGARAVVTDWAHLRAALFWEDARDDIYPVFDPTQGFGRNINVDKTRRRGVEWGLKTQSARADAFLNHTFTRASFGSDMTLDKAPFPATQQVRKGDSVPMLPQHRVAAGVSVRPREGWTTSLDGACASSQHLFGDEANDEAQLPAYCALNLGASFEKADWRVFVNGYNVLGSRYQARGIMSTNPSTFLADRFLLPASGAQVFGGLSYRFQGGAAAGPVAAGR